MERINALFLSSEPIITQMVEDFFSRDDKINFTVMGFNN